MGRKLLLRALALAGCLLACTGGKSAAPAGAVSIGGGIEISANGLRIEPGQQSNFLRFEKGVRVTGKDFTLRADVVELDVDAGAIGMQEARLPRLDAEPKRVISDPGGAVQQMAREIRGPSTRLEPSVIQRIAASGRVEVEGPGLTLSTATIYSEDGGTAWSTGGPASLTLDDRRRQLSGSFTAELMSFNQREQVLLARGGLKGEIRQPKGSPVTISARELRANLRTSEVEIRGGLELGSGSLTVRTLGKESKDMAPVLLNLASRELHLDGSFTLFDAQRGLQLEGSGLRGTLDNSPTLTVSNGVTLRDDQRQLRLTARQLSAELEPLRLLATGDVKLRYGKSSYESERALVTAAGKDKPNTYILEIEGPQQGSFDLQELRNSGQASPAGKP